MFSSKFWWHHLIRYSWHVSENRWFTPLIIVVHLMNQPVSIPDSDKTYHKICVYFVKDNYFNLSCSVSWQYQTLPQLFLIYITMLCFFIILVYLQRILFHKGFMCTLVSRQYTVNMNADRNVLPIVIKTRYDYTPISSWQKITLNLTD